jgi:hypothetical protein
MPPEEAFLRGAMSLCVLIAVLWASHQLIYQSFKKVLTEQLLELAKIARWFTIFKEMAD